MLIIFNCIKVKVMHRGDKIKLADMNRVLAKSKWVLIKNRY